jgi:ankyrin repeat protein
VKTPALFFVLLAVTVGLTSCTSSVNHRETFNQRLLNACFEGTGPVVAQLLKDGANPNATGMVQPFHPGKEPLSALEIACANSALNPESANIVSVLLKSGAKPTVKALVFALDGTQPPIVSMLVKAGVNVNQKARIEDREVYPVVACVSSPMASSAGSIENLQTLLNAKASLNVRDSMGRTPLVIAAEHRPTAAALIDALLSHGADVTAKDANGRTALDALRAEDSDCHESADYRPGACDSTEEAMGHIADATKHP